MKKTLTILALSSFTAAGAVYAQNASESVTDPMADAEMTTETARDTAVDTVVTGNGEVISSDDVVIGEAQRIRTDVDGNVIATIRLGEALDTDVTVINVPVIVEESGEMQTLRIGMTQQAIQAALDEQTG